MVVAKVDWSNLWPYASDPPPLTAFVVYHVQRGAVRPKQNGLFLVETDLTRVFPDRNENRTHSSLCTPKRIYDPFSKNRISNTVRVCVDVRPTGGGKSRSGQTPSQFETHSVLQLMSDESTGTRKYARSYDAHKS